MPRLTQAELNNLKYVSMADFSKRIDKIENINDKLKFATQYLILHGVNTEADCTMAEAIDIARMKIADASLELRQKAPKSNKIDDDIEIVSRNTKFNDAETAVNPYATPKDDMELELFMGHPVGYLKSVSLKKFQQIENQNAEEQTETKLKETCMNFYVNASNVETPELNPAVRANLHIKNRLEAMFGGKAALEKAFRDTQSGFFSKLFATASVASGNLNAVYKAFNDPHHVLYGDMNSLNKVAEQYLQHKFPKWKPGEAYPTEKELKKLDSTEKGRTLFSIAILDSVAKEKASEGIYLKIVNSNSKREDLQQHLDEQMGKTQEELHNKLAKDLIDELANNNLNEVIDRNTLTKENKVEQELDADESKLDMSLTLEKKMDS